MRADLFLGCSPTLGDAGVPGGGSDLLYGGDAATADVGIPGFDPTFTFNPRSIETMAPAASSTGANTAQADNLRTLALVAVVVAVIGLMVLASKD